MQCTDRQSNTLYTKEVFNLAAVDAFGRQVFHVSGDFSLAQELLQCANDRISHLTRGRCGAVERGCFASYRSSQLFFCKPDEVVKDDDGFSASAFFDLKSYGALVRFGLKTITQLVDQPTVHQTLRRRIEYIWVNRLTNLKAADFDQLF